MKIYRTFYIPNINEDTQNKIPGHFKASTMNIKTNLSLSHQHSRKLVLMNQTIS